MIKGNLAYHSWLSPRTAVGDAALGLWIHNELLVARIGLAEAVRGAKHAYLMQARCEEEHLPSINTYTYLAIASGIYLNS